MRDVDSDRRRAVTCANVSPNRKTPIKLNEQQRVLTLLVTGKMQLEDLTGLNRSDNGVSCRILNSY